MGAIRSNRATLLLGIYHGVARCRTHSMRMQHLFVGRLTARTAVHICTSYATASTAKPQLSMHMCCLQKVRNNTPAADSVSRTYSIAPYNSLNDVIVSPVRAGTTRTPPHKRHRWCVATGTSMLQAHMHMCTCIHNHSTSSRAAAHFGEWAYFT